MKSIFTILLISVFAACSSTEETKEIIKMDTSVMDKIVVSEMIYQYAKNTDLGDAKASTELFTETGILESRMGQDQGRESILIHLEKVNSTVAKGKRHMMMNVSSVVTGDKATATSYMLVVNATDGTNIIMTGVYEDELVKENGEWKFLKRTLSVDPSFVPPIK